MIKKSLTIIILFLCLSNLYSQNTFVEVIQPESDFTEIKKQLKSGDNTLKIIENAFITWDYNLIEPLLRDEIKKETSQFFQAQHDSIVKYSWYKRTHNGPDFSFIPGGNFGVSDTYNNLRIHSNSGDLKVRNLDYSFYIKDSVLTIYAIRSSGYPYIKPLDTKLPIVSKANELTQALRVANDKKHTKEIQKLLLEIEQLEDSLINLPFFYENAFNNQLANNYGNLAWLLIFEKEYNQAIQIATKGLDKNNQQTWIYSNLALSNLLAGNKEVAENIYSKYKNQYTNNNKSFKEVFKADLKAARSAKLIDFKTYNKIVQQLNN